MSSIRSARNARRVRLGFAELESRITPAVLDVHDDVHRAANLPSTSVTLTGTAELHLTDTADPLVGSIVNLNSPDAWLFLDHIAPSVASTTYLSRVKVNDAAAVLNTNVRVVQYADGTVIIPHSSTFAPLEVFTGANFTGSALTLNQYTAYTSTNLATFSDAISSFKLKRGYTMTVATADNGTGTSENYVAQDGDLVVPVLPTGLNDTIQFIRVFPWRYTSKKGIAGNIGQQLDLQWKYNWNISENSTLDREYVGIRQTRWWPDLNQNWQTRGINTLLGYNEPDQAGQADLTVTEAVTYWPDLLATGLRVGAPAVSDGGLSWLYSFMTQAEAAGHRVDFVPVHYYRSHNPADPAGAATKFYNFLKGIYDTVKKPIWVTEWNNGANWTSDPDPTDVQQQACVAAMLDMLESTPFVERYALYNWVEDVRRVQWDDTAGTLTLAGQTYRDTVSTMSYRQELPDPGTTAAAEFNFENTTTDASSNGQPAMAAGARTYVPGMVGQALAFDGQDDSVQLSPRLGQSTDFTFASWVKWDGGANWQRIMDLGWDTNKYLFLTPKSSAGTMRFGIKNGGTEQQLNATTALPVGVWTHIAITISGSTGKLFVNGEVVATNTAMTNNPVDTSPMYNFLGRSRFSADPLFAGALDEVRFSNTALSESDIAALAMNVRDFGFESPTTTSLVYNPTGVAWTYSGTSPNGSGVTTNNSAFTSGNAVAPQGTQVAFLQGASTITQSLTNLVPGRAYTLTVAASQRQNKVGGQAGQTLDLRLDGVTLTSFTPLQSASTYADFSTTFTATAATQSLAIVGTNLNSGDNTAFVDRVRLVAAAPAEAVPTIALQAGSFRNAGFEESPSSAGWTRTGSATIVNANLRSGSKALRMTGSVGTAEQVVTGLKPNTTYMLSAFARNSNIAGLARIGVKNHGAAEQWLDTASTQFTPLALSFTTGAGVTNATVYASKPLSNFIADFDDFTLVEAPVATLGSFRNPGFEDNPAGTGWTTSGSAATVNSNMRSGARAMRMNGATGAAEQVITGLLPNTVYAVSAWARVSSASIIARLGVKNYGGADTNVLSSSTAYTHLKLAFKTGPSSTSATIYISKLAGSNAANFDDVNLVALARYTSDNTTISPPIQVLLDDMSNWSMTATSNNPTLIPDANLTLSSSGFSRTLAVTPAANQIGTAVITLTATDDVGGVTAYSFPFVVNGRPAATASSLIVGMNAPQTVTLAGTDPESQSLTYAITTPPANGTLSGTAPNLTYTPAPGYFGADSFAFKVNDGLADSPGSATVSITVVAPPSVTNVRINGITTQRSRVTSIALDFLNPVPAAYLNSPGAITLTRTSGGPAAVVRTGATGANGLINLAQNGPNGLTLTFSNANGSATTAGVENGSLADGRWTLAIPSVAWSTTLTRLFGDANADGTVDGNELLLFGNSFSGNDPTFDFDADGVVSGADLLQFGNRFGVTI